MTMTSGRRPRRLAALLAGSALALIATPLLAATGAPSGSVSLLGAVRDDVAEEVAATLHARPDVNARDQMGATPLAWAAMRDNPAVVKMLLDAGADPNLVDVDGVGPLSLAVTNADPQIVAMLLAKGANPNAARTTGETPLMTAARIGSTDIAKQLLAHGAQVNVHETNFDQTTLMWATGHPEIVRLLLDKGADVHVVTKAWEITATNYTPITFTLGVTGIPWNNDGEYKMRAGGQGALLFAVQKDDVASVKMLLDAGMDVNQASADGTTPLLAALYNWTAKDGRAPKFSPDLALASLLLDRGAKVQVADQAGYTPLHGAVLSLVLKEPEGALQLAFNPGLKSEPDRPRPKPPAGEDEVLTLVKRLLAAGADPNAATRLPTPGPVNFVRVNPAPPGSSAFHIAAATHSSRLVALLAEHGGDPNLVRKDGHTPFSVAVMNNDLPSVEVMAAHGADFNRRYNPIDEISDPVEPKTQARKDETILHIAGVSAADWVIPFLAAHGAPVDAKNSLGETPLQLADAEERFRYAHDREGPLGGGIGKEAVRRETQTTDALKKVSTRGLASAKPARRARPAA
ncbi:MAG TPA: ankyrin repeat domain-containing protein [Phenylobacterium sp.]|nr:ankyrin repeat domain-containing protein [Phenylobacterium sp.]